MPACIASDPTRRSSWRTVRTGRFASSASVMRSTAPSERELSALRAHASAGHWSTVKLAHHVVLEEGTELVAGGDHRFLTRRGWKHVTGAQHGGERRPHHNVGSSLLGTGAFEAPPEHSDDYERGYLCGMIRGDGTLGSHV